MVCRTIVSMLAGRSAITSTGEVSRPPLEDDRGVKFIKWTNDQSSCFAKPVSHQWTNEKLSGEDFCAIRPQNRCLEEILVVASPSSRLFDYRLSSRASHCRSEILCILPESTASGLIHLGSCFWQPASDCFHSIMAARVC